MDCLWILKDFLYTVQNGRTFLPLISCHCPCTGWQFLFCKALVPGLIFPQMLCRWNMGLSLSLCHPLQRAGLSHQLCVSATECLKASDMRKTCVWILACTVAVLCKIGGVTYKHGFISCAGKWGQHSVDINYGVIGDETAETSEAMSCRLTGVIFLSPRRVLSALYSV